MSLAEFLGWFALGCIVLLGLKLADYEVRLRKLEGKLGTSTIRCRCGCHVNYVYTEPCKFCRGKACSGVRYDN